MFSAVLTSLSMAFYNSVPINVMGIFQHTMRQNHDLVQVYSENVAAINPPNLAHFIDSYIK